MLASKFFPLPALVLFFAGLCDGATLAHRYSFENDASDAVGGNDGVLIDDAHVSGGELILDGSPNGPSGDSMGFTSTVGIGSNFGSNGVTFEAWYTDQGSGSWSKLFSFGNGTSGSNIIFNLQQGSSGQGRIQYQGMREANFGPRPAPGTEHHLALTISPTGEVNAWIDGAQVQASPPDLTGDGNDLSVLPSSWERIGASAWGDANMSGSVNEFRIWDGVMTAAEVSESLAAGPDTLPGSGPRIDSFTATPAARLESDDAVAGKLDPEAAAVVLRRDVAGLREGFIRQLGLEAAHHGLELLGRRGMRCRREQEPSQWQEIAPFQRIELLHRPWLQGSSQGNACEKSDHGSVQCIGVRLLLELGGGLVCCYASKSSSQAKTALV